MGGGRVVVRSKPAIQMRLVMNRDLTKGTCGHVSYQQGHNSQQLFDGFPFFVTRIVPGLYDIIRLPADMDEMSLIGFAKGQAGCNHLDACLAMNNDCGCALVGLDVRATTQLRR